MPMLFIVAFLLLLLWFTKGGLLNFILHALRLLLPRRFLVFLPYLKILIRLVQSRQQIQQGWQYRRQTAQNQQSQQAQDKQKQAELAAYQVLGVSPQSDWQTIVQARKQLIQRYHADRHQDKDQATQADYNEKVIAINHAYNLLKKIKNE